MSDSPTSQPCPLEPINTSPAEIISKVNPFQERGIKLQSLHTENVGWASAIYRSCKSLCQRSYTVNNWAGQSGEGHSGSHLRHLQRQETTHVCCLWASRWQRLHLNGERHKNGLAGVWSYQECSESKLENFSPQLQFFSPISNSRQADCHLSATVNIRAAPLSRAWLVGIRKEGHQFYGKNHIHTQGAGRRNVNKENVKVV